MFPSHCALPLYFGMEVHMSSLLNSSQLSLYLQHLPRAVTQQVLSQSLEEGKEGRRKESSFFFLPTSLGTKSFAKHKSKVEDRFLWDFTPRISQF